jgi:serine/threonine-protein kinase
VKFDRQHQIEQICEATLKRKLEERVSYLSEACGDDTALRLEVDLQLARKSESSSHLNEIASLAEAVNAQASTVEFEPSSPGTLDHAPVGETISHYRILKRLGEGGMGVVYLAEDTSLQRRIALKFLKPHIIGSDEHQIRFLREAQAVAALDHPNICTIHEIGNAAGQTFMAMAYIEGVTLSHLINQGSLKLDNVLDIAVQVGQGLQAAHQKGIVHRDIKTSNLIVTKDGRVKIMDFGLAQRTDETRLTKADAIVGTPVCMSPEQVQGEEVDHRTDIWALGVAMYEMVTGRLPFAGKNSQAVLYSIVHKEHKPTTSIRSDVPIDFERIVGKALSKNPDERYSTIDEMLIDLRRLQESTPQSSSEAAATWQSPNKMLNWGRVLANPRRKAVLAGAAVAAILLVLALSLNISRFLNPIFATAPNSIKSVAVLPLQNLASDPEQDYFAEGMTEALITDISKIGALKVISRKTTMRYSGSTKPLNEIARDLKVDAIVEGSVTRVGDKVRVTARLIEAATDRSLWTESYERDLTNILALQAEVARTIAGKIKVTVSPEENARLARDRKVDPATYEAYLRGMFYLNKGTPDEIKKGMAYFHEAVEKDPGDPQAYAGLALGYVTIAHGPDPPEDALLSARAAAERAVRLDDTQAEAHLVLAVIKGYYDYDWGTAQRMMDHALEINPSLAIGHYHNSWFHVIFERYEDAIKEHKLAQELDPLTPLHTAWLGEIYRHVGRYEEAIAEANKSIEINPKFPIGHIVLARVYSDQGKHEDAIAEYQKAGEVALPWKWAAAVGYVRAGKPAEARKLLAELQQQKMTPWNAYWLAILNAWLGNKDEAFRWLNHEPHHMFLPAVRKNDWFKPLQGDPRHRAIVSRLKLPPP